MKPVLYVVRHGAAADEETNYGGDTQTPLGADGKRAAKSLGQFFAKKPIGKVISSDLKRAHDTGKAIAGASNTKLQTTDKLRPWDFGTLGGARKTEKNKDTVENRLAHPDKPLPGGESVNNFRDRIRPQLGRLIDESGEDNPNVIVTHSWDVGELGQMLTGDHKNGDIKPGGILEVYRRPKGKLLLKTIRGHSNEKESSR